METGNKPTRTSFEVEKEFGGLENVPNQSLVPRRSQAINLKGTTGEPFETTFNKAKKRKSGRLSYN